MSNIPVNPYTPTPIPEIDDAGSPSPGAWRAPLLRLVVVLACTLAAAGFSVPHDPGPHATSGVTIVILVLNAIFGALLGIGCVALGGAVMRRDRRWLMPGHWRALETLTVLAGVVASLPWRGQPGFTIGISAFFMEQLSKDTARNIAGVLLYLAFACFTRERMVWRAYAWAWLAAYAVSLVQIPIALFNARADMLLLYLIVEALPWISALAGFSGTLIVIVGVILDARAKLPRDLGHYAGIVLPILAYATFVLASVFL